MTKEEILEKLNTIKIVGEKEKGYDCDEIKELIEEILNVIDENNFNIFDIENDIYLFEDICDTQGGNYTYETIYINLKNEYIKKIYAGYLSWHNKTTDLIIKKEELSLEEWNYYVDQAKKRVKDNCQ